MKRSTNQQPTNQLANQSTNKSPKLIKPNTLNHCFKPFLGSSYTHVLLVTCSRLTPDSFRGAPKAQMQNTTPPRMSENLSEYSVLVHTVATATSTISHVRPIKS